MLLVVLKRSLVESDRCVYNSDAPSAQTGHLQSQLVLFGALESDYRNICHSRARDYALLAEGLHKELGSVGKRKLALDHIPCGIMHHARRGCSAKRAAAACNLVQVRAI
jgi:hypothetical protein